MPNNPPSLSMLILICHVKRGPGTRRKPLITAGFGKLGPLKVELFDAGAIGE